MHHCIDQYETVYNTLIHFLHFSLTHTHTLTPHFHIFCNFKKILQIIEKEFENVGANIFYHVFILLPASFSVLLLFSVFTWFHLTLTDPVTHSNVDGPNVRASETDLLNTIRSTQYTVVFMLIQILVSKTCKRKHQAVTVTCCQGRQGRHYLLKAISKNEIIQWRLGLISF